MRFAYILDVIVDPDRRGQGIGRAMVKYAMNHPEMSLVYQWVLKTKDAHRVYTKLGFGPINDPERWMAIQGSREERSQFQTSNIFQKTDY